MLFYKFYKNKTFFIGFVTMAMQLLVCNNVYNK